MPLSPGRPGDEHGVHAAEPNELRGRHATTCFPDAHGEAHSGTASGSRRPPVGGSRPSPIARAVITAPPRLPASACARSGPSDRHWQLGWSRAPSPTRLASIGSPSGVPVPCASTKLPPSAPIPARASAARIAAAGTAPLASGFVMWCACSAWPHPRSVHFARSRRVPLERTTKPAPSPSVRPFRPAGRIHAPWAGVPGAHNPATITSTERTARPQTTPTSPELEPQRADHEGVRAEHRARDGARAGEGARFLTVIRRRSSDARASFARPALRAAHARREQSRESPPFWRRRPSSRRRTGRFALPERFAARAGDRPRRSEPASCATPTPAISGARSPGDHAGSATSPGSKSETK